MKAVECIGEVQLHQCITWRQRIGKPSGCVNGSLAPARNRHTELMRAEVAGEPRGCKRISAFRCYTPPDIANCNWTYATRFLVQCNKITSKENWSYCMVALPIENTVYKRK